MIKLAPVAAGALLALLGFLGGKLFKLLRFPVPFLLGPMVVVSLSNLLGLPIPVLPNHIDKIAQVILGFCLGVGITRDSLRELRVIAIPALAVAIWSLLITFIFSFFLHRATSLSLTTAVLSSSPGGVPEVVIMAMSVGADAATVTVMQVARLFAVVLFVPLFGKLSAGKNNTAASCASACPVAPETKEQVAAPGVYWPELRRFFKALANPGLLIAFTGGLLFSVLKIPAGYMIGAMVATGVASVSGLGLRPLPPGIRTAAYIVVGILVGQFFTREVLGGMVEIYPIILLLTVIMLLASIGLAWFISRLTGWTLMVCLLSAAPGGLMAMTTLASDLDSEPVKVSLLHLSRLVAIKLILPLVILFI